MNIFSSLRIQFSRTTVKKVSKWCTATFESRSGCRGRRRKKNSPDIDKKKKRWFRLSLHDDNTLEKRVRKVSGCYTNIIHCAALLRNSGTVCEILLRFTVQRAIIHIMHTFRFLVTIYNNLIPPRIKTPKSEHD